MTVAAFGCCEQVQVAVQTHTHIARRTNTNRVPTTATFNPTNRKKQERILGLNGADQGARSVGKNSPSVSITEKANPDQFNFSAVTRGGEKDRGRTGVKPELIENMSEGGVAARPCSNGWRSMRRGAIAATKALYRKIAAHCARCHTVSPVLGHLCRIAVL